MITFSGVRCFPGSGNCPTPEDMAVAMCRITRYGGALWVPLATHSILVAGIAADNASGHADLDPDLAFGMGLLHDAHETVTGEITGHWKPPEMKKHEDELDALIFKSFGISLSLYRHFKLFFKLCDRKALVIESTVRGLKDWPEYYRQWNKEAPPEVSDEEVGFGAAILSLWKNPRMILSYSPEVMLLWRGLELLKQGARSAARGLLTGVPRDIHFCPFCGKAADDKLHYETSGVVPKSGIIDASDLLKGVHPENVQYSVCCGHCAGSGPLADTQEQAMTAWARRHIG